MKSEEQIEDLHNAFHNILGSELFFSKETEREIRAWKEALNWVSR